MDNKALEAFAAAERNNLRSAVKRRLSIIGIDSDSSYQNESEWIRVNGRLDIYKRLFKKYKEVGYEALIEETAYTWFNWLMAICYMEVKGVLPDYVKIIGNNGIILRPEILANYQDLGDEEAAYRKLFLAACNKLCDTLPLRLKRPDDWMEFLLPDNMLEPGGMIDRIVSNEGLRNSFEDGVEAIGWLHQFYMSEKKKIIGGLKSTAVKKADLPVVTQLFTPRWIIDYMIENSLGKLYDEWNEQNNLSKRWPYYLKHDYSEKLFPDFKGNLEEIKFFDPACGSGHILVAAFEYFYEMYIEQGYRKTEIPMLILEKNLYGCDIDKQAAQIASFALYMKATEKDPRMLRRSLANKFNVIEIVEPENLTDEEWNWIVPDSKEKESLKNAVHQFMNGKQFGSLIKPEPLEYHRYIEKIEAAILEPERDLVQSSIVLNIASKLLPILRQAKLLVDQYDVVVTNPPYHNKYNSILKSYMERYYSDYRTDMYSAFMARCLDLSKENGYVGMMTPFTWMFIISHEKLRKYIIENYSIASLIQLEYSAFKEAVVPICTFVIHKQHKQTMGEYVKLSEFKEEQSQKVKEAVKTLVHYRYCFDAKHFTALPTSPIAFSASHRMREIFKEYPPLMDFAEPRVGLQTGENEKFLRLWHEVQFGKIGLNMSSIEAKASNKKWFPYNKGGFFRRWYGNQAFVVNFENDGFDMMEDKREKLEKGIIEKKNSKCWNKEYYFLESVSWSKVSSGSFSARYYPKGFVFDVAGTSIFCLKDYTYIMTAFLNSKVLNGLVSILSPTLNFEVGTIKKLPIHNKIEQQCKGKIDKLTMQNIEMAKLDWDSFETSWYFRKHPFIMYKDTDHLLSSTFKNWNLHTEKISNQLHANEEDLNRIFIELYGLENELTPEVHVKDNTIRLAERGREVKSFLSYFIGCWLGRFSLDQEGIAYAGGEWDASRYKTFQPSRDGLVTITDEKVLSDECDVYECLKEFLMVIYGKETLRENLSFIAESLGRKTESVEKTIRNYFVKNFAKDHTHIYKNRPIYWQIDSGKENGMKSLIYLHRYTSHSMVLALNNHFVPLLNQWRLLARVTKEEVDSGLLNSLEQKAKKSQMNIYRKRVEELEKFQVKLHDIAREEIEIDLDDGVKVNYPKFSSVLTAIQI